MKRCRSRGVSSSFVNSFLELIEHQYESRGLVLQHAARLSCSDRQLSERRRDRVGRLGGSIAQMRGKTRNRLARSDEFRQTLVGRNLRREPAGQRIKKVFALLRIAGAENDASQERDAGYAPRHEEPWNDASLHQGRFAGTARPQQ